MPPEAAVAEPQIATEDVAADPAPQEALPTPPEDAPQAEEAPEAEGTADGPEGITYDAEIEAELEAEVERRVAERAAKAEADIERRVVQRAQEADQGEQSRIAAFDATIEDGRAKAASMLRLVREGEALDQATLDAHMTPILAGVHAMAAKDNEGTVKTLLATLLPEQTEDEKKALDQALYDFRRNGRIEAILPKAVELGLARRDAEIADLKRQLGDRSGLKTAAEKLAKVREAAGPSAGADVPAKGKTNDSTDAAREQRLAYGTPTAEDKAWLQQRFPG